jgi:hypothetical protein
MTLILILDLAVIALLCATAVIRGFEGTLPLASFLLILFPNESQIHLPGLFDLTTQRLIVLVLIALYVFMGKARRQGNGKKAKVPNGLLILLLLAWMFVSTLNSVVFAISLKSVLSQLCDFLIPYYIFSKVISKSETVHEILFAFVAAVSICSVFGAVEAYTGWNVRSLFPWVASRFDLGAGAVTTERGIRVQSTFGHPILFGGALAMAIPLALYLIPIVRDSLQRAFLWVGLMLMFLNIYKTGSRGPWLALILSLGVLLLFGQGRMRRYLFAVGLLSAVVLILRPGVWESLDKTYGATESQDSVESASYRWRYELYHLAGRELDKSFTRAMWGYGPESFYYLGLTMPFYQDGEVRTVRVESCDSSVVALVMETGYVGFLLAAAILIKAALATFLNFRRMPRPNDLFYLVLFSNMLAFYFLMTNVAIYAWGQQAYMLWIIMTLAMTYPQLPAPQFVHNAPLPG